MRIYKVSNEKDKLYFTNYKRIDEEIVFNEIKDILSKNSLIKIGDKIIGPSEDIYRCSISDQDFELIFDIDYGGYIYCNSEEIINSLEDILNK